MHSRSQVDSSIDHEFLAPEFQFKATLNKDLDALNR